MWHFQQLGVAGLTINSKYININWAVRISATATHTTHAFFRSQAQIHHLVRT